MAENRKYLYWIMGIIIAVILIYLIYPKPPGADKATAECIGKNSVIYISTGCSACAKQKSLFGSGFKYLNVVDCAVEPEKCSSISSVPTWIISGEFITGVQSVEVLKALTGC